MEAPTKLQNKSYFYIQIFTLRFWGVSLKEHETKLYKILSRTLFPLICLYPFLAVGDLFKYDFEIVADLLTYQFPITVGIIKALGILYNRAKIARILNELDGELSLKKFSSGNPEDEALMKQCILITTLQTSIYLTFAGFSFVFAVIYSASTRIRSSDYHDWQFPYGIFSVVNVTYSPNYEISAVYQSMVVACIASHFTSSDLLIAAILCHICFHLRILQNKLRRMSGNIYNKLNGSTTYSPIASASSNKGVKLEWKNLQTALKAAVKYHVAIINITKEVDQCFSTLLLLVFLGTLGIQSFLVYKASLIPLTDVRMLRSFGELGIMVIQVLLVCFWTDEMVFQGKQVGYAAYEANFVGTDLRFQKSLVLIMARSQYPVRLTAGFVDVSLGTFTWILRSTYSYYMILRKQNLQEVSGAIED